MSWFNHAIGGDKPNEPDTEVVTSTIFEGSIDSPEMVQAKITEAIGNLMNYALSYRTESGKRPFTTVDEKIVFKMIGVTIGDRDDPAFEEDAGDFEIEIRRVR